MATRKQLRQRRKRRQKTKAAKQLLASAGVPQPKGRGSRRQTLRLAADVRRDRGMVLAPGDARRLALLDLQSDPATAQRAKRLARRFRRARGKRQRERIQDRIFGARETAFTSVSPVDPDGTADPTDPGPAGDDEHTPGGVFVLADGYLGDSAGSAFQFGEADPSVAAGGAGAASAGLDAGRLVVPILTGVAAALIVRWLL